ncbi:MAG: prolipoprotein diacylglyceryl transferase [Verrucomicrobia bacterium]|nr:prolipoprotein diacylglyceryl transferase [Verrucomicrobiota bacterium]MBI3870743.1 prolipoprotein diacylglyceryl transferase [Verrucomicrobiota bacterium]
MHKIALELGPLTIHWYGVFVGLGCLLGLWSAARRGLREGLAPERTYDFCWWILLGAVVGARVWYVASYWSEDFADKSWLAVFNIRQGGLVFYGGVVGSSLALILYSLLKRQPLWLLADIATPSIALGSALGRIGCLMTGCCYGSPCSLPWAIRFPEDHATRHNPVHPVQIYDALINLALYLFLELSCFRRRRFDGQVFVVWLLIYPFTRSFTELFRGDYPQRYLGGSMTPAQAMSLFTVVAGVALYFLLPRRLTRRAESSDLAETDPVPPHG